MRQSVRAHRLEGEASWVERDFPGSVFWPVAARREYEPNHARSGFARAAERARCIELAPFLLIIWSWKRRRREISRRGLTFPPH